MEKGVPKKISNESEKMAWRLGGKSRPTNGAQGARQKFCKSTTRWYEATSILEFAIARESGRREVAMNRLVRSWLLRFIIAQ